MRRQLSQRSPKIYLRHNHNPDSDESISDEDDVVYPNNVLSLEPTKQELPLPVRLEILKGISNQNLAGKGGSSSSFSEKSLEDEVEMPDFKEGDISGEVVANSTDEEINSADECFPHHSPRRGKTVQLVKKSDTSLLQDTVVDNDDSPEPVDSGSSSDNEVSDHQHMKITLPGRRMQTMVDRFDEALGTSSVITVGALNSSRAGIFGKLQQVMQKEKEREMDFWKKLQAGARPDSELGCIHVKIISRYPDGKLTDCHCTFGNYTENSLLQDNSQEVGFGGRKSGQCTVIFSPRVCNKVDLEVGNLVRIHPPWKEVQVGNDNIILCTYFSKILSSV